MKTENINATGDCFLRAYNLIVFGEHKDLRIDNFRGEPKVVHGIVYHETIGDHVHAWVEDDIYCYDQLDGELVKIFKSRYYWLGNVKEGPGQIFRYSVDEIMIKTLEYGYYYFDNLPCNK